MLSRFASFAPAFKMQQPKMLSGGFFMQKLGINGSSQLSTTAESVGIRFINYTISQMPKTFVDIFLSVSSENVHLIFR